MSALIQTLQAQPARSGLWIERLAIYDEPDASHCLRDITFKRGLNIIWAHEPDESTCSGIRAAGHGVGKSSMCLLMRYCLGDDTKNVKDLLQEILFEFPQGGVGAVIHAGEETFSVFRHFNARCGDFCVENADLENCFVVERRKPYKEFEQRFSKLMLARVSPSAIPETGKAITWKHLLAWIVRDQSARFESYYDWGKGEGIGLTRSRQDPPAILRIVLGLLKAEEPMLQRALRTHVVKLEALENEMEQLRQAPDLIQKRIESDVRAWLSTPADLPMQSNDLFEDSIGKRVKDAKECTSVELKRLDEQENRLNEELVGLLAAQDNAQRGYEIADNVYKIADARWRGNEEEVRSLAEQQQRLQSLAGDCEHGLIAFKKCSHIQQRLQSISLEDRREKIALDQSNAKLAEGVVQKLADREQIKTRLNEVTQRAVNKKMELNQVRIRRRTLQLDEDRGQNLLGELERWEQFGSPEAADQLQKVAEQRASIQMEIDRTRTRLEVLRHEQSERTRSLSALVNEVTQELLSDQAFGMLDSYNENSPFRLSPHGGEAFRVLEILAGDLVCLLDAVNPVSAFPSMLIHDCPREADMGRRPYHDFLMLIERAEREAYGGDAPFQYIVTTTTPPPEHLQKPPYLRMELDPSRDEGFLFRKRFAQPETASVI